MNCGTIIGTLAFEIFREQEQPTYFQAYKTVLFKHYIWITGQNTDEYVIYIMDERLYVGQILHHITAYSKVIHEWSLCEPDAFNKAVEVIRALCKEPSFYQADEDSRQYLNELWRGAVDEFRDAPV